MLTSIAAIATAITALVGLGLVLWKKARADSAQDRADSEAKLAVAIQAATSDAERKKLSEELARLRNR